MNSAASGSAIRKTNPWSKIPSQKYPIIHDIQLIPQLEMLGYPKPGGNNPIIRLFIADVASKKLVRLDRR